jgi:hypothetical protein
MDMDFGALERAVGGVSISEALAAEQKEATARMADNLVTYFNTLTKGGVPDELAGKLTLSLDNALLAMTVNSMAMEAMRKAHELADGE